MNRPRTAFTEALNPGPLPSFQRARARRIPSGIEVIHPERRVRLRLPKDATSLDLLRAIYRHPRMPLETRIECANLALPYEHPRLVMIAPSNLDQPTQRLIISGGLPRLPGTTTVFPHDPPAPLRPVAARVEVVREEVEVGSCTVSETS
jgi:hypothetical protein